MNVLVYGLGAVGKPIFSLFGEKFGDVNMAFVSRNKYSAEPIINDMQFASYFCKPTIHVEYFEGDATDLPRNLEIFEKTNPDIILNTASHIPWWKAIELTKKLNIGHVEFGAWIPFNLAPIFGIVKALEKTGRKIPVISAAFPDSVNVAIYNSTGKILTGCGNVDLIIPLIKKLTIERFNLSENNIIDVSVIGHHYQISKARLGGLGLKTEFPHIDILIDKISLPNFEINRILQSLPKVKRPSSFIDRSSLVAATILEKISWLFIDGSYTGHCSGINGLVGGYPVKVINKSIELNLPKSLPIKIAKKLNEEGQRKDGIEKIDDKGVIFFTAEVIEFYRKLGIDLTYGLPTEDSIDFCVEVSKIIEERIANFK